MTPKALWMDAASPDTSPVAPDDHDCAPSDCLSFSDRGVDDGDCCSVDEPQSPCSAPDVPGGAMGGAVIGCGPETRRRESEGATGGKDEKGWAEHAQQWLESIESFFFEDEAGGGPRLLGTTGDGEGGCAVATSQCVPSAPQEAQTQLLCPPTSRSRNYETSQPRYRKVRTWESPGEWMGVGGKRVAGRTEGNGRIGAYSPELSQLSAPPDVPAGPGDSGSIGGGGECSYFMPLKEDNAVAAIKRSSLGHLPRTISSSSIGSGMSLPLLGWSPSYRSESSDGRSQSVNTREIAGSRSRNKESNRSKGAKGDKEVSTLRIQNKKANERAKARTLGNPRSTSPSRDVVALPPGDESVETEEKLPTSLAAAATAAAGATCAVAAGAYACLSPGNGRPSVLVSASSSTDFEGELQPLSSPSYLTHPARLPPLPPMRRLKVAGEAGVTRRLKPRRAQQQPRQRPWEEGPHDYAAMHDKVIDLLFEETRRKLCASSLTDANSSAKLAKGSLSPEINPSPPNHKIKEVTSHIVHPKNHRNETSAFEARKPTENVTRGPSMPSSLVEDSVTGPATSDALPIAIFTKHQHNCLAQKPQAALKEKKNKGIKREKSQPKKENANETLMMKMVLSEASEVTAQPRNIKLFKTSKRRLFLRRRELKQGGGVSEAGSDEDPPAVCYNSSVPSEPLQHRGPLPVPTPPLSVQSATAPAGGIIGTIARYSPMRRRTGGSQSNIEDSSQASMSNESEVTDESLTFLGVKANKVMDYLHPDCRLQKDKGRGEIPGTAISIVGREKSLAKLREKVNILAKVEASSGGDGHGHTSRARLKRKRAAMMYGAFSPSTAETRSTVSVKMGFLSMRYGILMRWDTNEGVITLFVLRKMCDAGFMAQKMSQKAQQVLALPALGVEAAEPIDRKEEIKSNTFEGKGGPLCAVVVPTRKVGTHEDVEESGVEVVRDRMPAAQSLISQIKTIDHTDNNRTHGVAVDATDEGKPKPLVFCRLMNGANAILHRHRRDRSFQQRGEEGEGDMGTEVALLAPPFRVHRPDSFPPPTLSVSVLHARGLRSGKKRKNMILNPYVSLQLGEQQHSSRPMWMTRNPTWEGKMGSRNSATFLCPGDDYVTDLALKDEVAVSLKLRENDVQLRVEIRDRGSFRRPDRVLGVVFVPLASVEPQPANKDNPIKKTDKVDDTSNMINKHGSNLPLTSSAIPTEVTIPCRMLWCPEGTYGVITLSLVHKNSYQWWLKRELRARKLDAASP